MQNYDVIVVGAGPAGSYSALRCAEKGLKTLLLDSATFPRDKPCGGILEAKYFVNYAPFLIGLEENITYHTSLYYNFDKILVRPLKSYIYKRIKFDQALVDHAMAKGVEFLDNSKVVRVNQRHNKIQIKWRNKDNQLNFTSAKICIGADGVNSVVRKYAGLESLNHKKSVLITLLVEEAESMDNKIWEITTEDGKPAIASYFFTAFPGFGWVAPAKDTINLGIGATALDVHLLKAQFKRFLRNLGVEHELKNAKSFPIPSMPLKHVYSGRIMLVGDAGGFVNPWTGGGINLGFHSAMMAAETAYITIENEVSENSRKFNLSLYSIRMRHTMKMLRLKGNLLKFLAWCYRHKFVSPQWEWLILRTFFPIV